MSESSKAHKIAVIGAGGVGATIAYACLVRGLVTDVAMYDVDKAKVDAYRAIAAHQPELVPAVLISPRVTAVLSPTTNTTPSLRDQHIQVIQEKGRRGWQKAVGFGKRSLVETAMFRYKTLIGPTLRARKFAASRSKPAWPAA